MSEHIEQQLRTALRDRQAVVVAGAGVSTAAAGLPDWRGLITSGLAYATSAGVLDAAGAERAQDALRESRFTEAATILKNALGAPRGEYPRWLTETFNLKREGLRLKLVDAIVDLPSELLATTNFDHLLTLLHPDAWPPVTWRDAVGLQTALNDGGRVLHLHGSYEDPASVVFGVENYADLIKAPAYEAVVRTLWLERVLLFVGCSFDGLTDPDFMKLISWAGETFPGTPHKHFALLQTGTFTTDDVRRFLNDWRIQIVPYGQTYADLPIKLARLNPFPERAFARRAQRAKELLAGAVLEDASRLADLLRSLTPTPDSQASETTFQRRATELLGRHADRMAQLRGDLRMLQSQAAAMVSPDEVKAQSLRWSDRIVRRRFDRAFLDVVLRATAAVYLFPETLLQELHRRGVNVHEAVVSGYVRGYVDAMARGQFVADDYTLENAARVLSTLDAINTCDPERVFPSRVPGKRLEHRLDQVLLVCRENRLELRDADGALKAFLPNDSKIFHAAMQDVAGQRVVVFADRHGVFAWEPLHATAPSAQFTIGGAFGVASVDHFQSKDGLLSVVSTLDSGIHLLRDLQPLRRIADPEGSLLDVVLTDAGELYGINQGRRRVRRWQDGRWQDVLTIADLETTLPRLPILSGRWTRRIAAENDALGELGPWDADDNRFQHPTLTRITLDGEQLLAFGITLSFQDANDQVILLFNPNDRPLRIHASYYRDGRDDKGVITHFCVVRGSDKVSRLVSVRLSDFELGYDLVSIARATPTRDGLALLKETSFGRTRDDLISLTMVDDRTGVAADDSGGLFKLSLVDRTFEELDRDKTSKIRSLSWSWHGSTTATSS